MIRKFLAGSAMVLALAVAVPSAMAQDGPRPSSANNWPGSSTPVPEATVAPQQPHYVWEEGYAPHGKWRSHWVLTH